MLISVYFKSMACKQTASSMGTGTHFNTH